MTEANVCFAFGTGAKKPSHIFSDLESVKLKKAQRGKKLQMVLSFLITVDRLVILLQLCDDVHGSIYTTVSLLKIDYSH